MDIGNSLQQLLPKYGLNRKDIFLTSKLGKIHLDVLTWPWTGMLILDPQAMHHIFIHFNKFRFDVE